MRAQPNLILLTLLVFLPAHAQLSGDWSTGSGDAQRTSWVRSDPKISVESMQKPGFEFLWKMRFENTQRQLNSLTAPVLMNRLIGYRGFRALAFVGGSADKVFVIDTDLARMEWQNTLPSAPAQQASVDCPGGLSSVLARATTAAFPPSTPTATGPGRGGPAKSAVGEPGRGAVTLAQYLERQNQQRQSPIPSAPPATAKPIAPAAVPPNRRADGPVYVLASSGSLHRLNVHNGAVLEPPIPFLPPDASAAGLIVVDRIAYAVTASNCGNVPSAVWALDLSGKQVNKWESKEGIAGSAGVAFGGDGSIYVATKGGELVRLESGTLQKLGSYSAEGKPFTSSPIVFEHKGKTLVAATAKDGRLHLVDSASMAAAVAKSEPFSTAEDFTPGSLATWQDAAGIRWLLSPTAGAIAAWKLVERNGTPALEAGWTSRNLQSPLPPMIVNGIVFAVSSGEFQSSDNKMTAADRARKSTPAVLYAFDGATGKELWNSGKIITSFVHGGGLAGAQGQVYVPTYDGTLYAFGFPIEH